MSILPDKLHEKQEFINEAMETIEIDVGRLLNMPSKYAILGRGKRLRPLICMLCAEATGGDFRASRDAFIALELVHNGTLIHDDIIDEDLFRRGNPSAHVKFGGKTAVLAGDVLLSLGLRYAAKTGNLAIVKTLADTSLKMVQGVALQTFYRRRMASEEEYLNIIYLKSGSLFEAAAKIGSLSAYAGNESIDNVSDFGRAFGVAYQIRDDILDALEEKERETRSDIANGDLTLPFIYAMQSELISDENKRCLMNFLQGSVVDVDNARIRGIYDEAGSIELAYGKMKDYAESSRKSLDRINPSEAKECLNHLLDQFFKENDFEKST